MKTDTLAPLKNGLACRDRETLAALAAAYIRLA
jgi:hypothetical protein